MPSPYDRPPNSTLNYPATMNAAAGRGGKIRHDALGRAAVRNPMRSRNSDRLYPAAHGVAAPKPHAYQDAFQRALHPPPGSPQHPGGIGNLTPADYAVYLPETGGRRPPGADLQALAATRKQGARR